MTDYLWGTAALAGVLLVAFVIWLLCWWHDRIDSEAYERGYEAGKKSGQRIGEAAGLRAGEAAAEARFDAWRKAEKEKAEKEERQRRESLWARDIPESREFEVLSVPTNTVPIYASVVVDERDLDEPNALTKAEVLRRLCTEILREAERYIVVQHEYDPRRIGTRFVGCLRVLERR